MRRAARTPTAGFDVQWIDGMVRATARGPISAQIGSELVQQVTSLALQRSANRLLYDFRTAKLTERVATLLQRTPESGATNVLRQARVAMLCNVRTTKHDLLEFTVSKYGHHVKVFTDGARALEWLNR